ncbi:RNA polymerase sigma-70 factor [Bacteroides sp.]|uniref:RNA polymerase sigma-70 factor n=1 Tax=Bacteroides sp. TaxID=29523 RepID=UPI001B69C913|nr:RNA polymerase sigma-70 factor [Bacteroides sp.]MBP6064710.1 RNA polymerase sigma-70 factor [Bacteroides sp.]MBP6068613.1 RNA polymerase sigma-70 factor [Bacteroides sp.]MBP6936884.1 RNA polymerase sigma-70 factor [Bacteroides sp.]MBP8622506.1 RNA polymerase sigma-70 factor [Bacteroides sp.]MBP9507615.1 RNA polymerase sigma-70 factor [Bacteroides sp.]
MDERTLVLQLKEGNENAFTTLYETYWAKVYNFSRLYLTSSTEIEEVVQDVFVKVWEARIFIKENENFKGFLFIITRNIIFNQFRKSFNENAYKLAVLKSASESYSIEEEMVASDLHIYINKLIEELPPRQQEVFKLSREKHLSYREIAQQLDISEKTVERHINEALKFLRKNIYLFSLFLSI